MNKKVRCLKKENQIRENTKSKTKKIYDNHMKKCGQAFNLNHNVFFPDSLQEDGEKWFDKTKYHILILLDIFLLNRAKVLRLVKFQVNLIGVFPHFSSGYV